MALIDQVIAALAGLAIPTNVPPTGNIVIQLKSIKQLLLNAMLQDALNPQPDYSLEGESVSRTTWRAALTQQIDWIDTQLDRYEPYEIYQIGM